MAVLASATDIRLDGNALVAANLAAIDRAIRFVSRQRRLSRSEADELASDVYLRLLQHEGAVLRGYRGDSSLHTFLVVVIQRVLLDARIGRHGKWRPSAPACRLGRVAIELEQLVFRDGLTLAEAAAMLRGRLGIADTDDELHFLLMLLPPRQPRRMVGDHVLEHRPSPAPGPDELLLRARAVPLHAHVARAIAALPREDREIVRLRFAAGLRLSEIARRRGIDEKAIYRRFHRALSTVRTAVRRDAPQV